MLKQHTFYLYYQENRVMARAFNLSPVVAKECESAQEAHDFVQKVINPEDIHPDKVCKRRGFNHPDWQKAISAKCEAAVREAYAASEQAEAFKTLEAQIQQEDAERKAQQAARDAAEAGV